MRIGETNRLTSWFRRGLFRVEEHALSCTMLLLMLGSLGFALECARLEPTPRRASVASVLSDSTSPEYLGGFEATRSGLRGACRISSGENSKPRSHEPARKRVNPVHCFWTNEFLPVDKRVEIGYFPVPTVSVFRGELHDSARFVRAGPAC